MEHISKAQMKLVRSLKQKKFRDELGLFVAEGKKCVEELQRYFQLELLISPDNATQTEIEQMSGLKTPQGIMAVFKKKPIGDWRLKIGDLTLALDGIQDPGNLGTIIRTCDWFGVHNIICSRDTADCYNPKVVQATMGSLGRVSVQYTDLPEWLREIKLKEPKARIIGTLLEGEDLRSERVKKLKSERMIVVMGSEGNGISEAVRRELTTAVRIPTYPENKKASDVVESLNVSIATAIILAELRLGS